MTNKAAQGTDELKMAGARAVECSLERTQHLLAEFRGEVERLLARVDSDVEKLREATLGEASPLPWVDPFAAKESQAERRIDEIVGEEQALVRIRALINEVIDERFRSLNHLIKEAQVRQSVGALQKGRLAASRRKL